MKRSDIVPGRSYRCRWPDGTVRIVTVRSIDSHGGVRVTWTEDAWTVVRSFDDTVATDWISETGSPGI